MTDGLKGENEVLRIMAKQWKEKYIDIEELDIRTKYYTLHQNGYPSMDAVRSVSKDGVLQAQYACTTTQETPGKSLQIECKQTLLDTTLLERTTNNSGENALPGVVRRQVFSCCAAKHTSPPLTSLRLRPDAPLRGEGALFFPFLLLLLLLAIPLSGGLFAPPNKRFSLVNSGTPSLPVFFVLFDPPANHDAKALAMPPLFVLAFGGFGGATCLCSIFEVQSVRKGGGEGEGCM